MAEDLESAVLEVVDDARIAAVDAGEGHAAEDGCWRQGLRESLLDPQPTHDGQYSRVRADERPEMDSISVCTVHAECRSSERIAVHRASAAAAGSEYDLRARITQSMTPISSDFV